VLSSRVAWALLAGLALVPCAVRAEPSDATAGEPAVGALLAEIRTRQAELERREDELADRERRVDEAQAALDAQAAELERLAADVERRIAAWQEEHGDTIRRLARIYAAMPPDRAAALLERLDVELATQVVSRMKDKQSAAVLGHVSRERAVAMSRRVAQPLAMDPSGGNGEAR
jgi:flagellar motility protein MotE (MotC chaperone)